MERILLVLQLMLPDGEDKTRSIEFEQPTIEVCMDRARLYLQTFNEQVPDQGGTAVAGCVVETPQRQHASAK